MTRPLGWAIALMSAALIVTVYADVATAWSATISKLLAAL